MGDENRNSGYYEPRWSPGDYTQIDLCECERLPCADDSFDLGLCSHVLEDLRDPVHVVNEVFRICRRVMVIAPSRFLEQMNGVDHPRYAGFYHHMWMLYEKDGELVFRRKTPTISLSGCHLSCPLFKTVTVEAGSFMYLGSKGRAREEMFWSEKEDAEDLKKFVNANKGRSGCFEFDPKWKRPSYVVWRLRQAVFGVE